MFDPKKFTTTASKPLPVVLMLDVSASMSGRKIDTLNDAIETMIRNFSDEEMMETEILVSVILFGGEVNLGLPYTKASDILWEPLGTRGNTPMGTALQMAKAMIEDKTVTLSRAYRPVVVLVSDGQPTDGIWRDAMNSFIHEGRSAKCDRMAMAIGDDADKKVLGMFTEGTEHPLFTAKNAKEMHTFFSYLTMSVTSRSRSANPNLIPAPKEIIDMVSVEAIEVDEDYEDGFY